MTIIIWELLSTMLIIVGAMFGFLLILVLIARFTKLRSLKFNPTALQRGEFVGNKTFITKDKYELNVLGEIKKESEYIFLCVHDFKNYKEEFEGFIDYCKENKTFSAISYDQRGCGENGVDENAVIGALYSDMNEIIDALKEKYEQKIVLLASGKSFALALKFANDNRVEKVMTTSIFINKAYKNGSALNWSLFMGTIFNLKKKIITKINGIDFSDNEQEAKKIEVNNLEKGKYTVCEYFQYKSAIKNTKKLINKSNNKVVIFTPTSDLQLDAKKAARFFTKLNKEKYELVVLENEKHFWINLDKKQYFDLILQKI
ncbi:hypothetical protein SCHIN_v1c09580 [Spiroplasma chinense]|uniref:Serine aminopeptidase S33 domain-containing protein n=1 Tax=Spiroplasma chinense TaxID=216932 RepID=A0A5B9Y530_9MOLU|nr:alpha/beta hydrolase [Spiroplasma chinense]QEH62151.1 hypothetical protein SCHIN_v1c09580 [Spiroplasma chinense]